MISQTQSKCPWAPWPIRHHKLGERQLFPRLKQVLTKRRWQTLTVTFLLAVSALASPLTRVSLTNAVEAQPHADREPAEEMSAPKEIGGVDTTHVVLGTPQTEAYGQIRTGDQKNLVATVLPKNPTQTTPLRGFCHPLNGKGWLSQGNGGVTHQNRMQYAYDHAVSLGTPVYAMRAGRVINLRDHYPDIGGGKERLYQFNYVWLEHDGGYRSVYIHLQQGFRQTVNLKVGDLVDAGQMIGFSGNSGWSGGPHLHVEVQQPGSQSQFTQTMPFEIGSHCTQPLRGYQVG